MFAMILSQINEMGVNLFGNAENAVAIKWFAALLVASQGSLIHAYGYKWGGNGKNVRLICSLIALMHYLCAGLVIWMA